MVEAFEWSGIIPVEAGGARGASGDTYERLACPPEGAEARLEEFFDEQQI